MSNTLYNQNIRICPSCNGQGKYQVMGNITCRHCAGTGRQFRPGIGLNPLFSCPYCQGKGFISGGVEWRFCNSCRGTGRR